MLHALMTNDEFTVALGGHSAAVGHGNNFWQSYTIQMHEVLEPVFKRLGITLVSRNAAMGGMGTDQSWTQGRPGVLDDRDWYNHLTSPLGR